MKSGRQYCQHSNVFLCLQKEIVKQQVCKICSYVRAIDRLRSQFIELKQTDKSSSVSQLNTVLNGLDLNWSLA